MHKNWKLVLLNVNGFIPRKQTPWPRYSTNIPARFAVLRSGGKEGPIVTGRKPGKDLVTTNQRPHNCGRWGLSGRSSKGKSHVGVHAIGEHHCGADHQARQSSGGHHCASGVATHLSMAGWEAISSPFIVFRFRMHNWLIDSDNHTKKAALRQCLFAGQRRR